MTELTPEKRRSLRAAAHHLNPVVAISKNGLQASVLSEINRCLTAHELIKVRLQGVERENRSALEVEICTALECAAVQQIGNLMVLYRENPKDVAGDKSALAPRRRSAKPLTKKQAAADTEARVRRQR
jgi:putative YhbY family RNA-binding protein